MGTKAKYKGTFNIRGNEITMGCDVSITDDKKISITNKYGGRLNSHYFALIKRVKELVSNGIDEDSFYDIVDTTITIDYSNLIDLLYSKTDRFKEEYLTRTETWANKEYVSILETTEEDVLKRKGYPSGDSYRHTKSSYAYWKKINSIKSMGLKAYIDYNIKLAENKYKSSIAKLAFKVKEKGLNLDKIDVNSDYTKFGMDGSLETIVSDGEMIIRAFTILAHGDINAPHYRYLIK